jgi:hypothetical protein
MCRELKVILARLDHSPTLRNATRRKDSGREWTQKRAVLPLMRGFHPEQHEELINAMNNDDSVSAH